MDIWEKLYNVAKPLYKPAELNEFIYANNVVCALESKSGKIIRDIVLRWPVAQSIFVLKEWHC